jgi:UDPglucose--hexose-1-phosphate uridylyltransferase
MALEHMHDYAEIRETIESLVDYASQHRLIGSGDRVWGYNTVLEAMGTSAPGPSEKWVLDSPRLTRSGIGFNLEAALSTLADVAVACGHAENTADGRDRVAMQIMGELMPRPSEVSSTFNELYAAQGPHAATDWFYGTCCDAGYVRRAAIARNIRWSTDTRWGDLEITINLSKPEKDPRKIATAGKVGKKDQKYPACQLCIENEGYPGRSSADPLGAHPARQNLRIVPITLDGQRWGLQYSPYAYFNEHCIAMSASHRPMHIDHKTIKCLLDFVDLFPHYFIGSNADLPIVGGSILSHDHFQGGAHEFPMMRAGVEQKFSISGFPSIEAKILRWPLSVLLLTSKDRDELLAACDHVIGAWRRWTDESAGIVARSSDGTPHNTVTPIIRRVNESRMVGGDTYEAYLALRCNVTSKAHPLGIFHPHEQWHHIKRENIGLIEVMGLAILPPRLKRELEAVRGHMLFAISSGQSTEELSQALIDDPLSSAHATWAIGVFSRYRTRLNEQDALEILQREVGMVFSHVLEDAGVFKWDETGREAQQRFIENL